MYDDMPALTKDSDFSDDSDSECEDNHQDFVNKKNQVLHTSCDPIANLYSYSEAKENMSKSVPCCCPCSERLCVQSLDALAGKEELIA